MSTEIESLVNLVLSSPRYRTILPSFVIRIGQAELAKGRSLKEAVKATKNKLHQVGGAYLDEHMQYTRWLEQVDLALRSGDFETIRLACRQILAHHASTRERLPYLEDFYMKCLAGTGPFYSVLDVACGLNPVSLPWMPLPPGCEYRAVDIFHDLIDFINAFFTLAGFHGTAQAVDVIESPPAQKADLALLLKTIPCLEQVDKNAGLRLLESLNADALLVSFPARSLGGRSKGMPENYASHFAELVESIPGSSSWRITRHDFPGELAFFVQK